MSKLECYGIVLEVFSASTGVNGMPRPIVEELNCISGFGIENDKFAGKDEEKSVMIIGKKSYDIAKEKGIELELGSYGENILLDFDPHELTIGDILIIGDTHIQITQGCTICNHLSIFDKELPELVKYHRGLYSKIIKDGRVKKGLVVNLKDKR